MKFKSLEQLKQYINYLHAYLDGGINSFLQYREPRTLLDIICFRQGKKIFKSFGDLPDWYLEGYRTNYANIQELKKIYDVNLEPHEQENQNLGEHVELTTDEKMSVQCEIFKIWARYDFFTYQDNIIKNKKRG